MARTHYQILLFPYQKEDTQVKYALFKRRDMEFWQGIAGGGEEGETPLITVRREAFEEAGIPTSSSYVELAAISTTPVTSISRDFIHGKDIIMIPEYAFGVEVTENDIQITSDEHTEFGWFTFEEAKEKLNWDSNKSALWELDYRLKNNFDGIKNNKEAIKKFL